MESITGERFLVMGGEQGLDQDYGQATTAKMHTYDLEIGEATQDQNSNSSSYAFNVCIEGLVLLNIDFALYAIAFIYVVLKGGQNKFGAQTVFMLSIPLADYSLQAFSRLYDSVRGEAICEVFFTGGALKWISEIFALATTVVVNVFMLRNMSVAAILKSETLEQEMATRKRLRRNIAFFLPTYFVLVVLIYICESLVFHPFYGYKVYVLPYLLLCNGLKLVLCVTLGVYTLIFSNRIQNLINILHYEFGNTHTSIKRLQLVRTLLLTMSVTYLIVDIFYNVVLPITLVYFVTNDELTANLTTGQWNVTLQLLGDLKVQVTLIFNL